MIVSTHPPLSVVNVTPSHYFTHLSLLITVLVPYTCVYRLYSIPIADVIARRTQCRIVVVTCVIEVPPALFTSTLSYK